MRKFNDNEIFCKSCLVHDTFLGDVCPECKGTERILYGNLSSLFRAKAREKFARMQEEK